MLSCLEKMLLLEDVVVSATGLSGGHPGVSVVSAWSSFLDLHLAVGRKDFVAADSARRLGNVLPLQDSGSGRAVRRHHPGAEPRIGGQPTNLADGYALAVDVG